MDTTKEIPIYEAEKLAKEYGYEQVIILALKKAKKPVLFNGWRTTFNIDKTKCAFLGKIAAVLINNFKFFYNAKEKYTDNFMHEKYKKCWDGKDWVEGK